MPPIPEGINSVFTTQGPGAPVPLHNVIRKPVPLSPAGSSVQHHDGLSSFYHQRHDDVSFSPHFSQPNPDILYGEPEQMVKTPSAVTSSLLSPTAPLSLRPVQRSYRPASVPDASVYPTESGITEKTEPVVRKRRSFLGSFLTKNAFRSTNANIVAYGSDRTQETEIEVRLLKADVMQPSADGRTRILKPDKTPARSTEMSAAGAASFQRAASTGALHTGSRTTPSRSNGPWTAPPMLQPFYLGHRTATATMSTISLGNAEQRPSARLVVSNDGNTLMTLARPDRIAFWDTASGEHLKSAQVAAIKPSTASVSREGDLLIFGDPDNLSIHVWNLKTLKAWPTMYCEAIRPNDLEGYAPSRLVVALSSRGNILVAMHIWHILEAFTEDCRAFLTFFDTMTGKSASTIPLPAINPRQSRRSSPGSPPLEDSDLSPYTCSLAECPDHFFGATFSSDGNSLILTVRAQVFVVDLLTRRVEPVLRARANLLTTAVPHSPNKFTFASVTADDQGQATGLRLWCTSSPFRAKLLLHPSPIVGFALSPGGTLLLVALSNLMVVLWDVATSRPLLRASTETHVTFHYAPAFSPCGRFFVTYHADACRLWRVPGNDIAKLRSAQRDNMAWAQLAFGAREMSVQGYMADDSTVLAVKDLPRDWPAGG